MKDEKLIECEVIHPNAIFNVGGTMQKCKKGQIVKLTLAAAKKKKGIVLVVAVKPKK